MNRDRQHPHTRRSNLHLLSIYERGGRDVQHDPILSEPGHGMAANHIVQFADGALGHRVEMGDFHPTHHERRDFQSARFGDAQINLAAGLAGNPDSGDDFLAGEWGRSEGGCPHLAYHLELSQYIVGRFQKRVNVDRFQWFFISSVFQASASTPVEVWLVNRKKPPKTGG